MPYKESITTFLDVLGFASMVSDENECERIERILHRLRSWTEFAQFEIDAHQQRSTNFSDCCVRSTPVIRDDGSRNGFGIFAHEILGVAHAQLTLIGTESVLLRGAVTIGSLHHEDNNVFGPALVRA